MVPRATSPKNNDLLQFGPPKARLWAPSATFLLFLLHFYMCLAPGRTILTNLAAYNAQKAKSRKKAAVFVISGPDLPPYRRFQPKSFLTVIGPKFERFHVLRPAKIGPKIRFVCSAPTPRPIEFLVRREEKSPKTDPRRPNPAEQLAGSARAGTHPNLGQHMARK